MPEVCHRWLERRERERFLDLVEAAFGERDLFARYLDLDPALDYRDTLVASVGERLVGCVQIFSKRIRLRGRAVSLGGIGSVATHPDYERRGIATQLLRLAIETMQHRGMLLSLLFTGRTTFYERLGWIAVPRRALALRASATPAPGARPFAPADLPAVRQLYDAYTRHCETTTVRDTRYWKAQLRYAGAPDEDFRVVERAGHIVAYARRIVLEGHALIMEQARAQDAAADLATLVGSLAPADSPLIVPRAPDPALEVGLRECCERLDAVEWPDTMWRVLDRAALESLSQGDPGASDAELLRDLVGGERAVYWTSDRF
ncbi:MAG: GNAT family N-acetyltransferase [Myxococcota bacterium]